MDGWDSLIIKYSSMQAGAYMVLRSDGYESKVCIRDGFIVAAVWFGHVLREVWVGCRHSSG